MEKIKVFNYNIEVLDIDKERFESLIKDLIDDNTLKIVNHKAIYKNDWYPPVDEYDDMYEEERSELRKFKEDYSL